MCCIVLRPARPGGGSTVPTDLPRRHPATDAETVHVKPRTEMDQAFHDRCKGDFGSFQDATCDSPSVGRPHRCWGAPALMEFLTLGRSAHGTDDRQVQEGTLYKVSKQATGTQRLLGPARACTSTDCRRHLHRGTRRICAGTPSSIVPRTVGRDCQATAGNAVYLYRCDEGLPTTAYRRARE